MVDLILDQWARQLPDLDASPLAVLGRLHRNYLRYQAQLGELFEEYGINMAAFDVLAALRRSGPPFQQTIGDLAGVTMVTSGGITQRVDRLEAMGLVERVRDATDRRVVYVTLTDKGIETVDRAAYAHFSNEKRMLSGLTETEQRQLARLLKQLERSLESTGR